MFEQIEIGLQEFKSNFNSTPDYLFINYSTRECFSKSQYPINMRDNYVGELGSVKIYAVNIEQTFIHLSSEILDEGLLKLDKHEEEEFNPLGFIGIDYFVPKYRAKYNGQLIDNQEDRTLNIEVPVQVLLLYRNLKNKSLPITIDFDNTH